MTVGGPTSEGGRRWSLWPVLVAGVVGLAAGFVVDLIWPNTVYGYQLYAVVAAILVVVVANALRPRVPVAFPAAVAAAVGLVAGMVAGLALLAGPPSTVAGSLEVRLEQPTVATLTSPANCGTATSDAFPLVFTPEDGSELTLADGRGLAVELSLGEGKDVGVVPRDDGLGIELRITETLPDGSPTQTRMGSGASSALSVTGTAAAGSMTFAGLVLHPESEQKVPIDVAGAVSWSCPAGS